MALDMDGARRVHAALIEHVTEDVCTESVLGTCLICEAATVVGYLLKQQGALPQAPAEVDGIKVTALVERMHRDHTAEVGRLNSALFSRSQILKDMTTRLDEFTAEMRRHDQEGN